MSVLRDALERQLLDRLREAWRTQGVGTMEVGAHYIQWAMYPEGLQVECVSNAFLEGDEVLGFVQRRQLDHLGFRRPDADVPNYYRRFESEQELPIAADALVQVIEQVLDVAVLERLRPRPGNVCVIVPVGKCFPEVLKAVTDPMIGASCVRCPTVVIDAFRWGAKEPDALLLDAWLAEPDSVEFPTLLTATFSEWSLPQLLAQAGDLARACELLRMRGAHVIVLGPPYLPWQVWLYNGLVGALADGLIAVSNTDDLQTWEPSLAALFSSGIRYTVLAGYGPGKVAHGDVRWTFHFDPKDVHFNECTGAALGLYELAGPYVDSSDFPG